MVVQKQERFPVNALLCSALSFFFQVRAVREIIYFLNTELWGLRILLLLGWSYASILLAFGKQLGFCS